MTTTPTSEAVRLEPQAVGGVVDALSSDFGRRDGVGGVLANQVLLDALDRGERQRFLVWPPFQPAAVLYVSPTGTLAPAGDPRGGAALAAAAEKTGWRVLVGDAPLGRALLEVHPRGVFRRRPSAREQRLMTVSGGAADVEEPAGFRRAIAGDVDRLTELACRLHVEDRMGPPISRSALPGVRSRMANSVAQGMTFVVERHGEVVAKLDLSLRSRRRGAQIAGVYVAAASRGQGLAGAAVGTLARQLLADGLPGVALHVRADNHPAIAAYRRAGLRDSGAWLLALR
ncbi:MAG: GNAT family N-acetyltransferase [Euzebyaceae bacterium]|jgi:ribosomal protein S18 acetylase RimI-like enzyme|nr:GNAT family N-acetyltransferase [Euzebyaceae bacterium]